MSTEELSTSLEDDLSEAYDKLAEEVEETETVDVAEEETVEADASDEIEKIEATDDTETDETDASKEYVEEDVEEQEEETIEEPEIEPMAHWLQADKEKFKELPNDAKEFLIRRDKEFQRHANERVQESIGVQRALDPVRQEMQNYGISDDQAVRTLVGAHKLLSENPKQGIQQLMARYRLTPEELFSADDSQPVTDPRIDALEHKVTTYEQLDAEKRYAAMSARIEEFSKNAEFFDEVRPQMEDVARLERMRNPNVDPDIAVVYNKACQLNDNVRMILAKRELDGEQKAESTTRSKIAAGAKVKGSPAAKKTKTKTKPETMGDQLSRVYDEIEERENATGI